MSTLVAVDPLVRLSIACPALPLCGLALTEAERRMPTWLVQTRALMNRLGFSPTDQLMLRVTGCPNGCARPYMAELALVGDGPEMYQAMTALHNSPSFLSKYVNVLLLVSGRSG